jgi:hypothetical protein
MARHKFTTWMRHWLTRITWVNHVIKWVTHGRAQVSSRKRDKHIILYLPLLSWYPSKNWFPIAEPRVQSTRIHKWTQKRFLPYLIHKTLTVLDKASYHSIIKCIWKATCKKKQLELHDAHPSICWSIHPPICMKLSSH